jgi:hypothetical protein
MSAADVGARVVTFLRGHLGIDDEWSVAEDRGFTWWGGPLAQRVWADPCFDDDGITLSRVHVRTDLVTGVPDDDERIAELLPALSLASMSGLIRGGEDGSTLQLASSVYVHDQTEQANRLVVGMAAALQAAEAYRFAPAVAELVSGTPAASHPPGRPTRAEPDEMLGVIENLIYPAGLAMSLYTGPEFAEMADQLNAGGFLATADHDGLTAEFPFGDFTLLLKLDTADPHPVLGCGLHARLTLPMLGGEQDGPGGMRVALGLNAQEVADPTHTHFLGSWRPCPRGFTYAAFYPNFLSQGRPGFIRNVVLSMFFRARWAATSFGREFDPVAANRRRAEALDWIAGLTEDQLREFFPDPPAEDSDADAPPEAPETDQQRARASRGGNADGEKPIRLPCPGCGRLLGGRSRTRKIRCPRCGNEYQVSS